jgi:hypothetical protein
MARSDCSSLAQLADLVLLPGSARQLRAAVFGGVVEDEPHVDAVAHDRGLDRRRRLPRLNATIDWRSSGAVAM